MYYIWSIWIPILTWDAILSLTLASSITLISTSSHFFIATINVFNLIYIPRVITIIGFITLWVSFALSYIIRVTSDISHSIEFTLRIFKTMELASMRIIEHFLKQFLIIIVTILPSSFDLRRVPHTIRIRDACFILSYLAACMYFCLILHGSFVVGTYFGSSCLRIRFVVPLAIIRSTVFLA